MWRQRAKALFFQEHEPIGKIAVTLGKTRETVSRFICKCPDYQKEMDYRKKQSAEKRKQYQREWGAANRKKPAGAESRYNIITAETIRAEQAQAARILSREKN